MAEDFPICICTESCSRESQMKQAQREPAKRAVQPEEPHGQHGSTQQLSKEPHGASSESLNTRVSDMQCRSQDQRMQRSGLVVALLS
jgi:hypothetical protein